MNLKKLCLLTVAAVIFASSAKAADDELNFLASCKPAGRAPLGIFKSNGPSPDPHAVWWIEWKQSGAEFGAGWLNDTTARPPAYWGLAAFPRDNCNFGAPETGEHDGEVFPFGGLGYFMTSPTEPASPEELRKMVCDGSAVPVRMKGFCVRAGLGCSKITLDQRLEVEKPEPGYCD
jgi:hypothetical protein